MNARDAYILLNMMEKVGPVVVRALTEHLGTIDAIFSTVPVSSSRGASDCSLGVGDFFAMAGVSWCIQGG